MPYASKLRRRSARPGPPRLCAPDAATLLNLMWLASPALPVGGYSYSEGLEIAVETGHVLGEAGARAWLQDQLHLGLARSDLAVCARAHGAWQRGDRAEVSALNDWITTTRETSELRQQTQQMGRSLTDWLRNHDTPDARVATLGSLAPAPTWPVAYALAAVLADATPRDALLSFGFGWAENMVQAALKAVPLGQAAGQRVLRSLVAALPGAVDGAMALGPTQRQAHTPMLAILSAQHETQYSRLFRS